MYKWLFYMYKSNHFPHIRRFFFKCIKLIKSAIIGKKYVVKYPYIIFPKG